MLTACAPKDRVDSILLDYQWRMSNVFELDDAELEQPATVLQPSFPRRRALLQEIPPLNINLLEFLRLSRCELQRLVGQRNSSLGIVMPSSQRFLYELSFLQLAQDCIGALEQLYQQEHGRGDEGRLPMIRLLQTAVTHKQHWLGASYWNALWGSQEFQQLFSTATTLPRTAALQAEPVSLQRALEVLAAGEAFWLGQSESQRGAELEQALAIVGSEKYLGQLRLAMVTMTRILQATTDAVDRAQARQPVCPQNSLSPQGKIMQRVFLRYYIGEVQPLVSLVHQRVSSLQPLLTTALAVSRKLPAGESPASLQDYWQRVWADSPGSEWRQFASAVAGHTKMWQRLLRQCGLRPGVNPDEGRSSDIIGT